MPVLGDLIVRIKVEGEGQAVASIQRVNQTASNTGRSFSSTNSQLSNFFNILARGSGNATTSFVNMGDGVKVVNNNFLDLITAASTLGTLLKQMNFGSMFKGFKLNLPKMKEFAYDTKEAAKSLEDFFSKGKAEGNKRLGLYAPQSEFLKLMDIFGPQEGKAFFQALKKPTRDGGNARNLNNILAMVNENLGDPYLGLSPGQYDVLEEKLKSLGLIANNNKSAFEKLGGAIGGALGQVVKFFNNSFMAKAYKAMGPFLDYMGKLIAETAKFYGVVFSVAIPALTAIATAASQAAANLERMRIKLKATLLGQGMAPGEAATKSKDMLMAIKELSAPSTYTAQQIGEAAQRMEAFGLNSIKTLKIGLKLAEVFGGMPDDLEMVVRMFGRMASGDLPDIEVLSRFGISKKALNAAGGGNLIDMNTGKLAGSPEQGVAALAKIIEDRYSKVSSGLSVSFDAAFATLQEKFTNLLEKIGEPINYALIDILRPVGEFVDKLISSGIAKSFGEAIASVIEAFGDTANAESFKQFGLFLIAFLQEAANELKKFVSGFAGFLDILRGAAMFVTGIKTFGISFFTQGTGLPEMGQGFGKILNPKNFLNLPGFFGSNVFERQAELNKKLKLPGVTESGYVDKFKSEKFIKSQQDQEKQLEEIKNNTGRAADALELRKANLGGRGGPLAQLGMGINVNQAGTTAGVMKAALPPSFALLNPVNQLQKSIQMEVFRTTNQQYIRRY